MRRERPGVERRTTPGGGVGGDSTGQPATAATGSCRGAVTMAVSFYLVGLVLSVAANSGSGSSALVRTVHDRLFSPWMVPAWLDLGFDYRLTYGIPDDAEHLFEVRPWGESGAPRRLPALGVGGERAARWRRLARAVARGEADPDQEGVLPEGLATGLFSLVGSDDVSLRVVRMLPPDRLATGTGPVRDEAFACRLRRVAGRVQLIRDTPAEELAPLLHGSDSIDRGPPRPGTPSGPVGPAADPPPS